MSNIRQRIHLTKPSRLHDNLVSTIETVNNLLNNIPAKSMFIAVHNAGNTVVTPGSRLVFPTTNRNDGSMYNPLTGIATIPTTGTWEIGCHVLFNSTAGFSPTLYQTSLFLIINGSVFVGLDAFQTKDPDFLAATQFVLQTTHPQILTEGDTIELIPSSITGGAAVNSRYSGAVEFNIWYARLIDRVSS